MQGLSIEARSKRKSKHSCSLFFNAFSCLLYPFLTPLDLMREKKVERKYIERKKIMAGHSRFGGLRPKQNVKTVSNQLVSLFSEVEARSNRCVEGRSLRPCGYSQAGLMPVGKGGAQ
jgi:hypothetical protein